MHLRYKAGMRITSNAVNPPEIESPFYVLNTTVRVHYRLYSHAAKVATKLEAVRRERILHPKDEATGVPLFVPQVGRAPAYSRNHAELPIGDYLYGMRCDLMTLPEPYRTHAFISLP